MLLLYSKITQWRVLMTILKFSTEMWLYIYGYIPLSPRNLSLMYYHLGCAQAFILKAMYFFSRAHTLTLSLLSSKCAHTLRTWSAHVRTEM